MKTISRLEVLQHIIEIWEFTLKMNGNCIKYGRCLGSGINKRIRICKPEQDQRKYFYDQREKRFDKLIELGVGGDNIRSIILQHAGDFHFDHLTPIWIVRTMIEEIDDNTKGVLRGNWELSFLRYCSDNIHGL